MNTCLALFNLGGGEIVLIFVVILILFGSKKIPEFAKGLGQGIKEFKKASREVTDEIHSSMNEPATPPPAPRPPADAPTTSAAPSSTVPKA
jgi:sec-independent protein translocase protein TatA